MGGEKASRLPLEDLCLQVLYFCTVVGPYLNRHFLQARCKWDQICGSRMKIVQWGAKDFESQIGT